MFIDLVRNLDEKDFANMTPEEVKKASRNHRIKRYKIICFSGIAILLWRDRAALLNKLYQYNHTAAYICNIYFTFALVSMLLGVIASSFPDTAPCSMAVSWNGTLQVFLFMIASFHLDIMEFYTNVLHLMISFVFTSTLFSIYWLFCARDPVVHLVKAGHHE